MLHSEYMSENVTEELEEVPAGTTHRALSCTLTPTYTGSPVTAVVESPWEYPLIQSQVAPGNKNKWALFVGTVKINSSGRSELSRLRMEIDLTPIEDSLGYNPIQVRLSVDDHDVDGISAPYEVIGTFEGNNLVFDFPLYVQFSHSGMGAQLDFGNSAVCDAFRQRTVEYANPMRMILTQ